MLGDNRAAACLAACGSNDERLGRLPVHGIHKPPGVPVGHANAIWKGDHYHGLGMRFAKEMDESDQFFFAKDAQKPEHVRGVEFLTRASWAAYYSMSEGQKVTVAMFDAPNNPRYPAHWFTMYTPFSFLSATINSYREPFEIKAGQTARFRYGIAVFDGHEKVEDIERLYDYWLKAFAGK